MDISDTQKILREHPNSVDDQKLALYDEWLRRYPSASWEHVIAALEVIGENTLASQITSTTLNCDMQSEEGSTSGGRIPSAGELAMSEEDLKLQHLSDLHKKFVKLTMEGKQALRNKVTSGNIHLSSLKDWLIEVLQPYNQEETMALQSIDNIDEFNLKMRDYYNFLDCSVLFTLLGEFLNDDPTLANSLQEYDEEACSFMNSAEIGHLKNKLRPFIQARSPYEVPITLTVENCWGRVKPRLG